MFENTIFKNPIKWAEMLAANRFRYIILSVTHTVFGILMVIIFSWDSGSLWIWIRNGIFITILNIEMPLYYLRALRKLVIERQKSNINKDC
jgi:hypothetical protein